MGDPLIVAYTCPVAVSPDLSARELEVVGLIVDGLSNAAVAAELGLSIRTVHAHVARAMAKTETRTRTQLAVHVLRAGIVPLQPCDGSRD